MNTHIDHWVASIAFACMLLAFSCEERAIPPRFGPDIYQSSDPVEEPGHFEYIFHYVLKDSGLEEPHLSQYVKIGRIKSDRFDPSVMSIWMYEPERRTIHTDSELKPWRDRMRSYAVHVRVQGDTELADRLDELAGPG